MFETKMPHISPAKWTHGDTPVGTGTALPAKHLVLCLRSATRFYPNWTLDVSLYFIYHIPSTHHFGHPSRSWWPALLDALENRFPPCVFHNNTGEREISVRKPKMRWTRNALLRHPGKQKDGQQWQKSRSSILIPGTVCDLFAPKNDIVKFFLLCPTSSHCLTNLCQFPVLREPNLSH